MADKAKPDDFWAGTTAPPASASGSQGTSAPAENEDWKIWQQGGDSGSGAAKPATDWLSHAVGQETEPQVESALEPTMHDENAGVIRQRS